MGINISPQDHIRSRIPTKYYSCLPDTPLPPQKFALLQVGFKAEDPPSFYTLPSFGNLFFKKMQMLRVVDTTRRLCVAPMSEATGYTLALKSDPLPEQIKSVPCALD